jgi:hypothetical protein
MSESTPHDPFGRCPPISIETREESSLSREDRVHLIDRCVEVLRDAVRNDQLPEKDAVIFVYGALSAWLQNGGSLERDFFKTVKAKSRLTASAIWHRIKRSSR